APGRGVIDDDTALAADPGRKLLRYRAARRHQADVGVGEVVVVERLHLQRAVAIGDFRADRAARGERHHFVGRKAAFFQYVEHFPADIARGAGDCDLETHLFAFSSSSPPASGIRRSMRFPLSRARPGERASRPGKLRPFWSRFWPWFW